MAAMEQPSTKDNSRRWCTVGYAVRLAVALTCASIAVALIHGPGGTLLSQWQASQEGGSLIVPASTYVTSTVALFFTGLLVAGLPSFMAVLLRPRPASSRAVLRRLMVGPLIAGLLIFGLSLAWGAVYLDRALVITVVAGLIFAAAGVIAKVVRIPTTGAVT